MVHKLFSSVLSNWKKITTNIRNIFWNSGFVLVARCAEQDIGMLSKLIKLFLIMWCFGTKYNHLICIKYTTIFYALLSFPLKMHSRKEGRYKHFSPFSTVYILIIDSKLFSFFYVVVHLFPSWLFLGRNQFTVHVALVFTGLAK